MKKLIFIAATIFLLPFIGIKGTPAGNPVTSHSQSSSSAGNAPAKSSGQSGYISPTPGHFPIIACSPISDNRIPTKDDINLLIDCRFNAAMTVFHTSKFLPLMKEIDNTGLTLLPIMDNYTVQQIKDTIRYIRRYMNDNGIPYSMIGGYRVKDEPIYDNMKIIGERHAAIKSTDPYVMPFVNLAAQPIGDFRPSAPQKAYSSDPFKRDTMSMYFDHFYDMVHPDVWSYDFYPFLYKSEDHKLHVNYQDFYYNLQLFARMSKENAIPFWAYCQSTNIRFITIADSMGHYTYTEHPEAKKEYLRYEAFNALALGAKAITYWRYSYREDGNHPDTVGTTYEHYISSLTDKNGKPTRAWNEVRKVNQEILAHEDLFMNTELQSYSLLGDTASLLGNEHYVRPTYGADIPEYDGPLRVEVDSGPGVLVSSLKHGNHLVTFIVNQSPFAATKVRVAPWGKELHRVMVESEHADSLGNPLFYHDFLTTDGEDPQVISIDRPVLPDTLHPINRLWGISYRLKPAGYMILEYDYTPIETASGRRDGKEMMIRQNITAIRVREFMNQMSKG